MDENSDENKLRNRDDVMNKTIMRIIRRYFTKQYKKAFPPVRFRQNSKRIVYYYNSLSLFFYRMYNSVHDIDVSMEVSESLNK